MQIAPHNRLQVRVDNRRGRALEFAELGTNFGRERNRRFRKNIAANFLDALLVRRIQKRKEQTHRNRFDALRLQIFHRAHNGIFVERMHHIAVRINTFVHFRAQKARHERFGRVHQKIVQPFVGTLDARDFQHIAKTARRQQAHARAFAFDERVRANRRAVSMHHIIQIRNGRVRKVQNFLDAIEHALRGIFRRGKCFGVMDFAVLVVYQHDIRKCSAYVNADTHLLSPVIGNQWSVISIQSLFHVIIFAGGDGYAD